MAKRGPQSELTDRNWDVEEEPEEAGIFKQATKATIEQRVIKRAKRRGPEENSSKPSAFGGFGGLTAPRPAVGLNSNDKPTGFKLSSDSTPFKSNLTAGGAAATSPTDHSSEGGAKMGPKENNTSNSNASSYLSSLKSLNESVLAWIKQHVDKNPHIDLTPIFKDYEKYMATLESKKTATTTNGSSSATPTKPFSSSSSSNKKDDESVFSSPFSQKPSHCEKDSNLKGREYENNSNKSASSFGSLSSNGPGLNASSAASDTTPASGFSFGKTSAATSGFSFGLSSGTTAGTSISSTGGFSFGQLSSSSAAKSTPTPTASTGFSFGSGSTSLSSAASSTFGTANSGFSFGALAAKTVSAAAENPQSKEGDDEDYVPPKPEVKEIKEDDSIYSKRCKLFYQKDGQWIERGVGNVHVKPLEETKTQVLVRADTNLGNILLNIMLTSGTPMSRQGKNNVMLVCVPNPPLKEGESGQKKAVPMLLRVKTGDEADELLALLEKRKALL